jgi:hypothetical protein
MELLSSVVVSLTSTPCSLISFYINNLVKRKRQQVAISWGKAVCCVITHSGENLESN